VPAEPSLLLLPGQPLLPPLLLLLLPLKNLVVLLLLLLKLTQLLQQKLQQHCVTQEYMHRLLHYQLCCHLRRQQKLPLRRLLQLPQPPQLLLLRWWLCAPLQAFLLLASPLLQSLSLICYALLLPHTTPECKCSCQIARPAWLLHDQCSLHQGCCSRQQLRRNEQLLLC
jgi:hypothetical protein